MFDHSCIENYIIVCLAKPITMHITILDYSYNYLYAVKDHYIQLKDMKKV